MPCAARCAARPPPCISATPTSYGWHCCRPNHRGAHGVTVIWYPLKDRATHSRWKDQLRRLGIPKFLCVEHWLYDDDQSGIYNGAGLFIVNPPYAFTQALPPLQKALRAALAPEGHSGEITSDWLGR